MAGFNEEIVIRLKDEFTASANKIQSAVDGIRGAYTGLIGAAALGGLSAVIYDTVHAFAESEKSVTQLSFALKSVGITSKEVLDDYVNFSNALARNTQYTKEEIQGVERLFTQYGLYGDQLKRATKDVLDFAAAKGIDAQSAANLFAKAIAGNVDMLKRYGLEVNQSAFSTHAFNDVLAASEARFKGFSAAAAETTSGRLDQFKKSINELKESIGGFFASIDQKLGVTKGLTEFFNSLTDGANKSKDPIKELNAQIKALSEEKTKLKEGMADPNKDFIGYSDEAHLEDLKRINEITVKIRELTAERDKLVHSKPASTGSVVPDVKNTPDGAIPLLFTERQLDEQKKIFDKASTAFNSFFTDIEKNAGKAFAGIQANALNLIGDIKGGATGKGIGIAGSLFSAFTSFSLGLQSFVSMFDEDTRTVGRKLLDYIGQIQTAMSQAMNDLDSLRNREKNLSEGTAGNVQNIGSGDYIGPGNDFNQAVGAAQRAGGTGQGIRTGIDSTIPIGDMLNSIANSGDLSWFITDAGDFAVNHQQKGNLGYYDEQKKRWIIIETFFNEQFTLALCQLTLEYALKHGLATGDLGIDKSARTSSQPGSVSASSSSSSSGLYPSGQNYSSGISAGSNSQGVQSFTFNIQAIDAKGVSQFVQERLAPAMRYLSGRQGIVFLNTRGVSTNI